ncbi:uncharacterized protein LOC116142304 isoform X1 [Pistacia vera]|uniref:uncharacterized protein LOC116142304 isoform X1 n=1 Tax=Pistacia vera TaxID=55513 RepID=UPI0012633A1B|nr:uncharacterized protein LOC116142304 isoform X1 [Pistacia vera]
MKLSPASVSKRRDSNLSGPRLRKKHKRLDAICEEEYNRNHIESNEGNEEEGAPGTSMPDLELRRSSRVRRAPVLLDVSPQPVKKRRRVDRNVNSGVNKKLNSSLRKGKEEESDKMVSPGVWGSRLRLRSRGRNVGFEVRTEESGELSGRGELFGGMAEEVVESGVSMQKEVEDGDLVVVNKTRGSLEEEDSLRDEVEISEKEEEISEKEEEISEKEEEMHEEEKEIETSGMKEESEREEEVEVVSNKGDESMPASGSGMVGEDEMERAEGAAKEVYEKEEREVLSGKEIEGDCIGDEKEELVETTRLSDKEGEHLEGGEEGEDQQDGGEDVGNIKNNVEDGGADDQKDDCPVSLEGKPSEGMSASMVDEINRGSNDTLGRPRIKQGRWCGLCGCGNDGKPPKRLIQDVGESENEAYSGSSASEEPTYDLWDGFGDEPGWLGRLLGPINDRYGIAGIWVHQHCAVWSPEVYFAGLGCLKNVRAALCRGRALKCTRCGRPGATIGCRVDRCPKTYHLPCARANGCIFDHRKFLIACTDHRHLFQPHGNQYLDRIKKLKARKMKLEMRKLSNDSWRKDVEAEEKWLENCGEDEEFLKRESKRLHRDLFRIAPVYIGGPDSESGKLYEGWESVAGLQDVIRCMKEVVILPLLYPEFFDNLGLTPPRGVLLHGYPGTGKTLVVRALIGSCARGDKRIAYFARKGADCLGKYVGDAERQLRLLFQVAEKCQPSIIFFDEIDGLAPQRTRQQDQTHSSVVSTLLALMDGLKSRGSVVVIGATNRPEAVDPALRRPGRFDREIYFPLPSMEDRAAILSLHTQRWPKPITGSLLKWIASRTTGFAGADLQALCTQAAIVALKRNFPLQETLSAAAEKDSGAKRIPLPSFAVEERDWLEALSCSPPPCSRREAGIAAYDLVSSPLSTHLIPCLLEPLSTLLVSLYLDERLWLPPRLTKAATMVKSLIFSALNKKNIPSDHWWSYVDVFLQEADVAKNIERRLSQAGVITGEVTFAGFDACASDTCDDNANYEPAIMHGCGMHTSLFKNISFASKKKSGFRILISGSPRSGQRHLAACLLHCFVGNVEIQKVDLATISQEGHDDLVQGLTQLLMKCTSVGSCLVFMPRIDLWAIETLQQVNEEIDSSSTNNPPSSNGSSLAHEGVFEKKIDSHLQKQKLAETMDFQGSSHAWSSFVEQLESLCVTTTVMILATSEVPYSSLPPRVRQFFGSHTSNCNLPIPLEHTVPRFSVQLGGNFKCDMVINLSAAELSRDIIQLVVQLVHQRTHAHTNYCKEHKTRGFTEVCTDTVLNSIDHGLANEQKDRTEFPEDSSVKVPPTPNNKILKGRSSLLVAISTFGYQILRYPHFAELCWFTSKLKDGPCADINGPWKGWPFNSCIIRPSDSVETVTVASGSSNINGKEKSGLVRGLIAVGLLAYRGVYASLREVSSDVRRVLELIVGEINAKVQAGKDRCQYIRLLSQVAYLEDVVNSWVYALQSLESDAQIKVANPELDIVGCPDDSHACEDNSIQSDECKLNVTTKSSLEPEVTESKSQGFEVEHIESLSLNNGHDDSAYPDPERRAEILEQGSAEHIVLPDTSFDTNLHDSVTDQSVDKILNEQNGSNLGTCESETTLDNAVVDMGSESLKHSNGFAVKEPVILSENGPDCSDEFGGINLSDSQKPSDQVNGLSETQVKTSSNDGKPDPSEHTVDDVDLCSSKTPSLSEYSGVTCSYHVCIECLSTLHDLMQKILLHTLGLNESKWTVEDVHDVVASLSVDLLSLVRKVTSSSHNAFNENLRQGNPEKFSEYPELVTCHCESTGNSLVAPMECSCHSGGGSATEANTQLRFDPKFVFRDGVLVPVDSNTDVSFHCTFEKLCLCSLIKSIVMMKQPLD